MAEQPTKNIGGLAILKNIHKALNRTKQRRYYKIGPNGYVGITSAEQMTTKTPENSIAETEHKKPRENDSGANHSK